MRQEGERTGLADYKQRIKQDASMPSNEIIFSDDENEEQIADAQDGNDGYYELGLGKPSMPTTSNQKTEYNALEIHNAAMQIIRYGACLRATAAITTATCMDEDKRLVIDDNKVKRAQEI